MNLGRSPSYHYLGLTICKGLLSKELSVMIHLGSSESGSIQLLPRKDRIYSNHLLAVLSNHNFMNPRE